MQRRYNIPWSLAPWIKQPQSLIPVKYVCNGWAKRTALEQQLNVACRHRPGAWSPQQGVDHTADVTRGHSGPAAHDAALQVPCKITRELLIACVIPKPRDRISREKGGAHPQHI
jgi:hypothetical protein